MSGFINPESKVMQVLYKITEMMLLSVLWIVTSLPLITIGAASSALYYAVVKVIIKDEGNVWGQFWAAFQGNFKKATIIWIPLLLLFTGAVVDIVVVYFLSIVGEGKGWLAIPFTLLLVFGLMWVQYIFPYVARFEDRIKTILYNTFWMSLFHIVHSLLLFVVFVILVALPFAFPILLPVAIFFFPGLYGVIGALVLESRFKVHIPAKEQEVSTYEEGNDSCDD